MIVMGQSTSCHCFEGLTTGGDATAKAERINKITKGATFMQAILLGMSSRKLFVRLSDEGSVIKWKTEEGAWQQEAGEVDLTIVKAVKPVGNQGLQFVSKEKILFEINAEDAACRDQWIIAISDILMGW